MAFSTPAAREATTTYKRCRTCGRATESWRNRCNHCLNDIADVPVLPADEAEVLLEHDRVITEERERRYAKRRRVWRRIRYALLAVALVAFAWWFYSTWIYEPPPVPLPTSTARSIVASPDSWPIAGGDLGQTRATTASAHLDSEVAWTTELGSPTFTSMVADAERVYLALRDGRIVAVDAASGELLWERQLQNPPFAAPTVADDRLYIAQRQGVMDVVDARTGELIYQTEETSTSFGTSPIVFNGIVYLFGTGEIVGFDAETGERLWLRDINTQWLFVTPVAFENFIAVATGDQTLVFDRLQGIQTYFYDYARAQPYSIIFDDGVVYSLSSRLGVAMDIDSARPWWEGMRAVWTQFWIWGMAPLPTPPPAVWSTARPPGAAWPAALSDEALLLASVEGNLSSLSRADGNVIWERRDAGAVTAPPTLTADGWLLTQPDGLTLVNPADGAEIERRDLGVPLKDTVVTNHGVYVTTEDGRLLGLR